MCSEPRLVSKYHSHGALQGPSRLFCSVSCGHGTRIRPFLPLAMDLLLFLVFLDREPFVLRIYREKGSNGNQIKDQSSYHDLAGFCLFVFMDSFFLNGGFLLCYFHWQYSQKSMAISRQKGDSDSLNYRRILIVATGKPLNYLRAGISGMLNTKSERKVLSVA